MLGAESDCWIDTEEFSQCEERGRRAYREGKFDEASAAFESAVALYRGEYLTEDRYEEWALPVRERFRERFVEVLSLLADSLARRGQYRAALSYLERAVVESPLDEKLYRQMMVYASCAGERAVAHRAYERCRTALDRELGERPSSQTEEIFRQIQSERVCDWERFYPKGVPEGIALPMKIQRPPFVGRTREWEQLSSALSKARSGAGHLVLILGEAGMGKTRLGEEFLRWAHEHAGAQALYGRCYELQNPMPLHLWVEVLRQGVSQLTRADLAEVPPAWVAELSELLPELTPLIPDLPQMALPREHRQYRLFETLWRILKALALRHLPLLLFVDDLQWADSNSLDFLCYLMERFTNEPLLIVGAARSEELSTQLERVRHQGVRMGRLSEIVLQRLSEHEIHDLVKGLADELETTADFGGRLHRESAGNPLFATAVLQALFENGACVREGTRWRVTDPSRVVLAPSAVQLLERRAKRVSAAAQRVLQVIACAVQIELGVLEAVWEGTPEELFVHLAELTAQGLLVEREGRYEFMHDKFREVVYKSLEGPRRTWLHRRLAHAIERVYADPAAVGLAGQLAQHYEQGGQLRRSLEWVLKAISECGKHYHIEEGLQYVARGLLLLQRLKGQLNERERTEQEFSLILERLDFQLRSGQAEAAQESCERLLLLAEKLDLNKKAQALHWKGQWLVRTARYEEALRYAQRALELDPPDLLVRANLFSQIGLISFYRGEYQEALHYYRQALEIFRPRDPLKAAYTWNDCANALMKLGDYQQALTHYEMALRLYQELQDLQKAGAVLNNIGATLRYLGRYERAREYLEQACALDKTHGDRHGLGYSLCNLAQTYRLLGLPAKALELSMEAYKIFFELEDPFGQCMMQRWIGVVYRDLGQHEHALRHVHKALEQARSIHAHAEEGACLVELAHTLLDMGQDTHAALEVIQHALALIKQHGWGGELTIRAHYLRYRALAALHDPNAFEALRQAYEELQKIAHQITDPSLRQSFLAIPLHRQILSEAYS